MLYGGATVSNVTACQLSQRYICGVEKIYYHSHMYTRMLALRHKFTHICSASPAPSISYYLLLWPPIDQGRSCAAYDVLYYLGISVIAGCWDWLGVTGWGRVGGGIRVCRSDHTIDLSTGDVKRLSRRWTIYGTMGRFCGVLPVQRWIWSSFSKKRKGKKAKWGGAFIL